MEIQHQLITYSINRDGTIPDFVYKDNDGIGGYLPIVNPNNPSPQEYVFICLTEFNISSFDYDNIYQIFTTKQELSDYINQNFSQSDLSQEDIDYHTNYIWDTYERVNNI